MCVLENITQYDDIDFLVLGSVLPYSVLLSTGKGFGNVQPEESST